ncbi:hypothetical protein G6F60_015032 [Rhizopus arrhizus]|nr:hypothetical protein G6F61_014073 [Rhizopus arrhizus]KAG1384731.1 hypothetical protein G6F60_015032 [Rhizopus arrhizus]
MRGAGERVAGGSAAWRSCCWRAVSASCAFSAVASCICEGGGTIRFTAASTSDGAMTTISSHSAPAAMAASVVRRAKQPISTASASQKLP